jgi:hypothetical protein
MKLGFKKTKNEQLQEIINDYLAETGESQFDMPTVAAWAIRTERWQPAHRSAIKQCTHELSKAARDEYYTDPQGRRVRCKHVIRQEQGFLWADIQTAPPEHMKLSLQQRRMYITGDCRHLKTDLDSFNDNNQYGVQLEIGFDFTEDLLELEMPKEYPDKKPE